MWVQEHLGFLWFLGLVDTSGNLRGMNDTLSCLCLVSSEPRTEQAHTEKARYSVPICGMNEWTMPFQVSGFFAVILAILTPSSITELKKRTEELPRSFEIYLHFAVCTKGIMT